MSNETQQVQKRHVNPIMAMVGGEKFESNISKVLDPRSVSIFVAHAKNQMSKNPKLQECTKESVYQCLMDCAVNGVMPDGRNAYLIPFNNRKMNRVDCTLIIGYQGLISCILRGDRVTKIHADVIHKNDNVKVSMGEVIEHSYDWAGDRGEITGVWARAVLSDGDSLCIAMTKADVEKIRQASRGKDSMPWSDHWGEQAKKTAIRRLSKLLPLNEVQQQILTQDDTQFDKPKVDIQLPDEDIIEG